MKEGGRVKTWKRRYPPSPQLFPCFFEVASTPKQPPPTNQRPVAPIFAARYFVFRPVDPAVPRHGPASSHELLYFKVQPWFGKKPKGRIAVDGSGLATIIGEAFAKGQGKCITVDTQGQDRQHRWIPDCDAGSWITLLRNLGRAEEERQGQT